MKHYNNKPINESLMEDDLKWLVDDTVLIDMHKTKLGKNKDHIVMALIVNDRTPANDLAQFIESSVYDFEDVEVSSATDTKGRYLIYVEVERGPDAYNTVSGILKDTNKLSGIEEWKFQGMGMPAAIPFNEENFASHIITDPIEYDSLHPEEAKDTENKETPDNDQPPAEESVTESIKTRLKFLMSY